MSKDSEIFNLDVQWPENNDGEAVLGDSSSAGRTVEAALAEQ